MTFLGEFFLLFSLWLEMDIPLVLVDQNYFPEALPFFQMKFLEYLDYVSYLTIIYTLYFEDFFPLPQNMTLLSFWTLDTWPSLD